jgi:hypothetical protein
MQYTFFGLSTSSFEIGEKIPFNCFCVSLCLSFSIRGHNRAPTAFVINVMKGRVAENVTIRSVVCLKCPQVLYHVCPVSADFL